MDANPIAGAVAYASHPPGWKKPPAAAMHASFLSEDDPVLLWDSSERRTEMPVQKEQPYKPSALAVLKPMLGGQGFYDFMYAGVFPATTHEPLTELQRRAETMQYSDLLDKAAQAPKGSEERLLLVAVFGGVCMSGPMSRTAFKSINPAMLETFELVVPEKGFKLLMEDVFHDPSKHQYITAWKAWGRRWGFEAEAEPLIRFNVSSLSVDLNSRIRAEITFDDGDFYTMQLPPTRIGSLTAEKQTFTFTGSLILLHPASEMGAELDLREPGMLTTRKGTKHQVKGWLTKGGKKVDGVKIHGAWDSQVCVTSADGKTRTLWLGEETSVPANRYDLGDFALQLNNLSPRLDAVLPPTDSRRRTDMLAIEAGLFDLADAEHKRIKKKNSPAARGPPSTTAAKWFEPRSADSMQGEVGQKLRYRYKGGYWGAREAAAQGNASAWQGCPDLFGLD